MSNRLGFYIPFNPEVAFIGLEAPKENNSSGGESIEVPPPWIEQYPDLNATDFADFIKIIRPSLTALLLCGYKIPSIDFRFGERSSWKMIRMNFKTGKLELVQGEVHSSTLKVRINFEPVTVDNKSIAIAFDESAFQNFKARPRDVQVPGLSMKLIERVFENSAYSFTSALTDRDVLFQKKVEALRLDIISDLLPDADAVSSRETDLDILKADKATFFRLTKELVFDSLLWICSFNFDLQSVIAKTTKVKLGLLPIFNPNKLVFDEALKGEASLKTSLAYLARTLNLLYVSVDAGGFRSDQKFLHLDSYMGFEEQPFKNDLVISWQNFLVNESFAYGTKDSPSGNFNLVAKILGWIDPKSSKVPKDLAAMRFLESFVKILEFKKGQTLPGPLREAYENKSLTELLFDLLDFGILNYGKFVSSFDLDGDDDDNDDVIIPEPIIFQTFFEGEKPTKVVLQLKNYDKFLTLTVEANSAHDVLESICWEYVPAEDEGYEDYGDLDEFDPFKGMADFKEKTEGESSSLPTLVVVAGPNVSITGLDSFKGLLELEIIRVQHYGLIPCWGERINVTSLMSKKALRPFYLFDSDEESWKFWERGRSQERWQQDVDFWTLKDSSGEDNMTKWERKIVQSGTLMPVVIEEPFTEDGFSGVRLIYQPPADEGKSNILDELPGYAAPVEEKSIQSHKYLGSFKSASVTIKLPTGSAGTFCYQIIPYVTTESRITGYENYTSQSPTPRTDVVYSYRRAIRSDIAILKFRLIIYRAGNVQVEYKDAAMNESQWLTVLSTRNQTEAQFVTLAERSVFDYYPYVLLPGDNYCPLQGSLLKYFTRKLRYEINPASTESLAFSFRYHNLKKIESTVVVPDLETIQGKIIDANLDVLYNDIDFVIGLIPVVGDVADIAELLVSFKTGTDKWGRPISNLERVMLAAGVIVPFVSGKALKALKNAAPAAEAAELFKGQMRGAL